MPRGGWGQEAKDVHARWRRARGVLVLDMTARGLSVREIADQLSCSEALVYHIRSEAKREAAAEDRTKETPDG